MSLARIEQLRVVQFLGGHLLTIHQALYDRTGGRIGHRILGVPCLLLRTTGAKTGKPRTSALTYARDGETYLLAASMGGSPRAPGWYHNLLADPEVEIQVGTRRMPVTARAVQRGDADYDRLWDALNAVNSDRYSGYQTLTTRPIPVVVLTLR
ncbi:MAG TPA: nitroreductase family deazaflavin-dependent oxidoreductase [Sporichthya sp.]|nr:nitroreductase family deazaflavin-dependent oxidoreductase [Sporichthya sp.]